MWLMDFELKLIFNVFSFFSSAIELTDFFLRWQQIRTWVNLFNKKFSVAIFDHRSIEYANISDEISNPMEESH